MAREQVLIQDTAFARIGSLPHCFERSKLLRLDKIWKGGARGGLTMQMGAGDWSLTQDTGSCKMTTLSSQLSMPYNLSSSNSTPKSYYVVFRV